MNTCKDCIHYDVCRYHIDEETTMSVNECHHGFKHKEQCVMLPAHIGQKVYEIRCLQYYDYDKRTWIIRGYEIIEGKVSMIQQKADKSWKIRITLRGNVSDYVTDEFNKHIFLTKSAAKEELKRLEGELK